MVTRTDLLQRACRHLSEAASEADISAALAALPDWSLEHGKLVRCFGLKDYHQTIAFVNAIASVIHQEDHHPELILTYQRCTVKYDTHSVNAGKGGLSDNDFICAAKIDAVFQHGFS
jgi:4a-hydroxytetrahydrobiopterin dehydratase